MDCPLRSGHDLADAYVAGTLKDPDQSAFEEHYFTCPECFAQVRLLQEVRDGLRVVPPRPTAHNAHARPWRSAPWIGLAAAAALLAAFVYWYRDDAPPQARQQPAQVPAASPGVEEPAPPAVAANPAKEPLPPAAPASPTRRQMLQQLAMMVPPRYVPLAVRGGEPSADRFDAAMRYYVAGRHREAARDLGALAADRPADPGVAFFLGISELASGRPVAAREALGRAAGMGVPPYADEAHFYLAKAALALDDVDEARRELGIAVAHEAGPEGEAARILAALDTLPR
jgi:anti-sigma factor RsiW